MTNLNDQTETFGEWLNMQRDRGGLVGQLVDGDKANREFPRNGSPENVRWHFSGMQAEGDLIETVDEAGTQGLSY